ncbi:MAG: hypothetical protein ACK5II_11485 [Paracoccus sp. (in: a-proteobacteria)]
MAVWPLSGLSMSEDVIEAATFAARIGAADLGTLPFTPLGQSGRKVWHNAGAIRDRLLAWFVTLHEGAIQTRAEIVRLGDWASRALKSTARMKGDTPARVIVALRETPLITTEMVEQQISVSRDTAERVLARLHGMGLIREVTGTRRYRLWSAP